MKTILISTIALIFTLTAQAGPIAAGGVPGQLFAQCESQDRAIVAKIEVQFGRGLVLQAWNRHSKMADTAVRKDEQDPRGLVFQSAEASLLIPNMQGPPSGDRRPKALLSVKGQGSILVLCELR